MSVSHILQYVLENTTKLMTDLVAAYHTSICIFLLLQIVDIQYSLCTNCLHLVKIPSDKVVAYANLHGLTGYW